VDAVPQVPARLQSRHGGRLRSLPAALIAAAQRCHEVDGHGAVLLTVQPNVSAEVVAELLQHTAARRGRSLFLLRNAPMPAADSTKVSTHAAARPPGGPRGRLLEEGRRLKAQVLESNGGAPIRLTAEERRRLDKLREGLDPEILKKIDLLADAE
jgi:hypothetical protein